MDKKNQQMVYVVSIGYRRFLFDDAVEATTFARMAKLHHDDDDDRSIDVEIALELVEIATTDDDNDNTADDCVEISENNNTEE